MLIAAVLVLCSLVELKVAPAPHPTLDELVKEYQYWQLPLPHPNAQLVRLRRLRDEVEGGLPFCLAFRNPPVRRGEPAPPPTGDEWAFDSHFWAEDAVLDRPGIMSADEVDIYWPPTWLRFVVAFRLRGWDDAAAEVYAKARKAMADEKVDGDEPPPTVLRELRGCAWVEWYRRLHVRGSDRAEALKRLRELTRLEPDFLNPGVRGLLDDLERTLAPRKGKPGTVEALIDDLTDYWETYWTHARGGEGYLKLAERGFDAVPALIEHLTDERLTRAEFPGLNNFPAYTFRVNHVVSALLSELSGGRLHNFELGGRTIDPGAALKWWGNAREVGEERWLLDHALPAAEPGKLLRPSRAILRALRAKYPHRLAEVYRAILLKRPDVASDEIATEIAASTLPRERKLALLEEGAAYPDFTQRVPALEALASVDVSTFRKHYVRAVEAFPAELTPWVGGASSEVEVAETVRRTADRACWDALLAATRRATSGDRLRLVASFGWEPESALGRRECVRYLLAFRYDVGAGKLDDETWAVRDLAATNLIQLLGDGHPRAFELPPSPRERSRFRERIWEAAERELARSAK